MTHPILKQKKTKMRQGGGEELSMLIYLYKLWHFLPENSCLFSVHYRKICVCAWWPWCVFPGVSGLPGAEGPRIRWDFPVGWLRGWSLLWSAQKCLDCGVHVQGGRESREEKDTQLRREGGTTVCPKSTTGLDTWWKEKEIYCSRRSLPRLCFDVSTVLCLLTCS